MYVLIYQTNLYLSFNFWATVNSIHIQWHRDITSTTYILQSQSYSSVYYRDSLKEKQTKTRKDKSKQTLIQNHPTPVLKRLLFIRPYELWAMDIFKLHLIISIIQITTICNWPLRFLLTVHRLYELWALHYWISAQRPNLSYYFENSQNHTHKFPVTKSQAVNLWIS